MWKKGGVRNAEAALAALKTLRPYLDGSEVDMILSDVVEALIRKGRLNRAKEVAKRMRSGFGFYGHAQTKIAYAEAKGGNYPAAIKSAKGEGAEMTLHEIARTALKDGKPDAAMATVRALGHFHDLRGGPACEVCGGLGHQIVQAYRKQGSAEKADRLQKIMSEVMTSRPEEWSKHFSR